MSNLDYLDLIAKQAKNETTQKIFSILLIALCSFFIGRSSVNDCKKDVICKDIIADRDKLSKQLNEDKITCQDEKTEEMKDLALKLERECSYRLDKALDDCEFSEEIHCSICIARGVCKP